MKVSNRPEPARSRCAAVGLAACLALALSPNRALALDPGTAMTQYVRDSWGSRDGLPQSSIQAIAQTPDGYLWLGTQEGLVRFDGVRFVVYDRRNTPALGSSNVLCLLVDRTGTLWVGTFGGGLVRFDGRRFSVYPRTPGALHPIVKCLFEGRDGSLWIGTFGGGVGRLKDGKLTKITVRDGLADDGVRALLEDRKGVLWIGTDAGLDRLDDGRFSHLDRRHGLPDSSVLSLREDRDGSLWVGTAQGLSRVQQGPARPVPLPARLARSVIRVIVEDRDGSLWVGTDTNGLWRRSGDQWRSLGSREGLSSDFVYAVFEDRERGLWLGTFTGGLNRLKDAAVRTFGARDGLPADITWSILEDREGALWISTLGAGLVRFKDGRFTSLTTRDGLSSNMTFSLHEDREGALWIGTPGSGLNRLREGRFTVFTTRDGLCNDVVLSLAEDEEGDLWIGTQGGLSRLRGGTFTCLTIRDGLAHPIVRALHPARGGGMWIGTWGGGLNRLQGGRFRRFAAREGLSSDIVESLYEDAQGTLWIGTQGGGLNRLRDGRFTTFTTRDGLPSDTAFTILEGPSNDLWLSSPNGIARVKKEDLEAVAAGAARPVDAVLYGEEEGMASSVCNGRAQPAGWRSRDGRLWFPTQKGIAVVDPRRIRANLRAPVVVVEQVLIDGAPVVAAARAPAGSRSFEFRYTGLSLLAPSRVRFRYRLEGFDPGWVDAGTRRVAYYTNIPAGAYRFRVTACNNEGRWNETGSAFAFSVRQHFHRTPAFYSLALAAVVLTALGFHRARMAFVEAKAAVLEERNRIAQEIHDGLAQELGGIIIQLEVAGGLMAAGSEGLEAPLRAARGLAQQSLEEARRSVWGLRPALLEAAPLPEAAGRLLERLLVGTGVELDYTVQGTPRPISAKLEVALLRIVQEAVFNAIRHAQPRRIEVALVYSRKQVELRVADDGRGFDARAATAGFGIPGMRRRLAGCGGDFQIRRRPEQGTEVAVRMPIGRLRLLMLRWRLPRLIPHPRWE